MAQIQLPFTIDGSDNGSNSSAGSRLHSMLPRKLQKACDEYPYLADYLNCIPIDEIGVPDYYPALSRRLKDLEEPNLIYATQEGLFVHIYPEPASERDLYIPIEPHSGLDREDRRSRDGGGTTGEAAGSHRPHRLYQRRKREDQSNAPGNGSAQVYLCAR